MLTIYGLSTVCPKCEQAKIFIVMYGYTGEWRYIEVDKEGNEHLAEKVRNDGFRVAPAVYLDDVRLGSVTELQKYFLDWRKTLDLWEIGN